MNIETFEQHLNLRIETYKMLKRGMSDPVAVEWASDCLDVLMEVKKDFDKCRDADKDKFYAL